MLERRKFLKTIARGTILTGIVGLSGYLLFKDRDDNTQVCNYDFICKNCKNENTCSLPEAEEHRRSSEDNL